VTAGFFSQTLVSGGVIKTILEYN